MPTPPGVKHPGTLKYSARYCVEVVAFMARGYSLTAFAGEIGTTRANLLKWCDKHPPFAAAVERAQARRARLLEDRLLATDGAGVAAARVQALKSAAPEDWSAERRARPAAPAKKAAERPVTLPDNGRR